jgi:cytochrome c oxidase accessory protein FixG
MSSAFPKIAPGTVLPTLNPDGSRRWIRPRPSSGVFQRRRQITAWVLMAVFFAIPYLRIGGRPLLLLDLGRREFTLFGVPFLASDTVLFMLLFLTVMLAVLLGTALLGRAWCGWACPQTVYLEFVFRPIERWVEGGVRGSRRIDARHAHFHPRRIAKYAIYLVLALFLAHTFLAYFVPVSELLHWVRRSPVEHPGPFFIMALTTGLMMFNFGWFREQTCMVACPYGRLQSALLDRRSLIVGYDAKRGEPRGKGLPRPAGLGDCIDCRLCVLTCPTGIDIREGLQMECIHCAQCVDACDAVMRRIGRPPGLIRYGTLAGFAGRAASWLRPRVIAYPAALLVSLGLFVGLLITRPGAEVTVLRGIGAPFTLDPEGRVVNQLRIHLANREGEARGFRFGLAGAGGDALVVPVQPLPVGPHDRATTSVFVVSPRSGFEHGERHVALRVTNGRGFDTTVPWELLGPESHETDEHDEDAARVSGGSR